MEIRKGTMIGVLVGTVVLGVVLAMIPILHESAVDGADTWGYPFTARTYIIPRGMGGGTEWRPAGVLGDMAIAFSIMVIIGLSAETILPKKKQ